LQFTGRTFRPTVHIITRGSHQRELFSSHGSGGPAQQFPLLPSVASFAIGHPS
jgi:hypothetical protein